MMRRHHHHSLGERIESCHEKQQQQQTATRYTQKGNYVFLAAAVASHTRTHTQKHSWMDEHDKTGMCSSGGGTHSQIFRGM